jgi:hypothetical protein
MGLLTSSWEVNSIVGSSVNHNSKVERFARTGTVSMCNHRFKARALLLYLSLNQQFALSAGTVFPSRLPHCEKMRSVHHVIGI